MLAKDLIKFNVMYYTQMLSRERAQRKPCYTERERYCGLLWEAEDKVWDLT